MALQGIPAGSRYGFIPGSQEAGVAMGYGPMYQGIGSLITPDDGTYGYNLARTNALNEDEQLKRDKFNTFKGLLSNLDGFGGGSQTQVFGGRSSSMGAGVPAPSYISAAPVYSQSQINAQAGLQRANLLSQANQNTRMFQQQLGSRGFSPLSPFGMLAGQSNIMRANAWAAQNETNLNFNAAQANSDAMLKAQQINAGLYGNYANALGQRYSTDMNFASQGRAQQNDMLRMILQGLAA